MNAVGGVRIAEPAADLAVVLAVLSSFRNRPLPEKLCWRSSGKSAWPARCAPRRAARTAGGAGNDRRARSPRANAPKQTVNGIEVVAIGKASPRRSPSWSQGRVSLGLDEIRGNNAAPDSRFQGGWIVAGGVSPASTRPCTGVEFAGRSSPGRQLKVARRSAITRCQMAGAARQGVCEFRVNGGCEVGVHKRFMLAGRAEHGGDESPVSRDGSTIEYPLHEPDAESEHGECEGHALGVLEITRVDRLVLDRSDRCGESVREKQRGVLRGAGDHDVAERASVGVGAGNPGPSRAMLRTAVPRRISPPCMNAAAGTGKRAPRSDFGSNRSLAARLPPSVSRSTLANSAPRRAPAAYSAPTRRVGPTSGREAHRSGRNGRAAARRFRPPPA